MDNGTVENNCRIYNKIIAINLSIIAEQSVGYISTIYSMA